MHTVVGEVGWEDYTVEAKVRMDEGNWAGLLLEQRMSLNTMFFI